MMLVYSPLLLLLIPLLVRLLGLKSDPAAPWRTRIDLPLLLGAALVVTTLSAATLHTYALDSSTTSCDAVDVCVTTALGHRIGHAVREAEALRQPGAAFLPSLLSRKLGIINGLAFGALLSAFGTALAIGLWARALFGRPAALAAILGVGAVGALVTQTRHLSFYPEVALGVAWAAVAGAVALRWRTQRALALAGAGVGLGLFMDHLGLLYGAVPVAIAFVVAVAAPIRRIPGRVLALALPIALSFGAARIVNPPHVLSFEQKLFTFAQDSTGVEPQDPVVIISDLKAQGQPVDLQIRVLDWALESDFWKPIPPGQLRAGWRWGYSGPVQAVKTGLVAALLGRLTRGHPPVASAWNYEHQASLQVAPWKRVAPVLILLTLLALRRRPLQALAFLLTLIPFVVSFLAAGSSQVWPKTLMAPSIPLPVALGVAFAWLAFPSSAPRGAREDAEAGGDAVIGGDGAQSEGDAGRALGRRARFDLALKVRARVAAALGPWAPLAVTAGLWTVLILGVVPTWLSPRAPWRGGFLGDEGLLQLYFLAEARRGDPSQLPPENQAAELCNTLMVWDIERGKTEAGWIYHSRNVSWTYSNDADEPQDIVPHK